MSAADMSKLAMVLCSEDEELKKMGFRILFPVHDEIIAEAPEQYAKKCGEIMSQKMVEAASIMCPSLPFKCDVEYSKNWSGGSWDCDANGNWYIADAH